MVHLLWLWANPYIINGYIMSKQRCIKKGEGQKYTYNLIWTTATHICILSDCHCLYIAVYVGMAQGILFSLYIGIGAKLLLCFRSIIPVIIILHTVLNSYHIKYGHDLVQWYMPSFDECIKHIAVHAHGFIGTCAGPLLLQEVARGCCTIIMSCIMQELPEECLIMITNT